MPTYTTSQTPAGTRRWSKHDIRDSLREAVKIRQNHRCAYCDQRIGAGHIDHVVPRIAGGSNRADNLVWSCRRCNLAKGDRRLEDWLRRRPEALARVLRIMAAPVDRKLGLAAAKGRAVKSTVDTQTLSKWVAA